MNKLENKGWRPNKDHQYPFEKGERHHVKNPFEPTRVFDQMFFIGDEFCCSPVFETSEGLLMIDCMEPDDNYLQLIIDSIEKMGHSLEELKTILITHGHVDHWGKADYFRDHYGTKIYMSKEDEEYAHLPNTRSPVGPMHYNVDGYIEDGDVFTMGETSVKVYATPGHTIGCLSFIINVTDNSEPHKMALWGGEGLPKNHPDKYLFVESCDYFVEAIKKEGADGEISNHSFVDLTIPRLEICRNLIRGMAHPFVIGIDATVEYHLTNKYVCQKAIERELQEQKK